MSSWILIILYVIFGLVFLKLVFSLISWLIRVVLVGAFVIIFFLLLSTVIAPAVVLFPDYPQNNETRIVCKMNTCTPGAKIPTGSFTYAIKTCGWSSECAKEILKSSSNLPEMTLEEFLNSTDTAAKIISD